MSTPIPQVQNTAQIRDAEFVKMTVVFTNGASQITRTFYFSNSYKPELVNGNTYNELGSLMGVSAHQRDLQASGYDTSISITGLDPYWIYVVAGGPATEPVPVSGQSPIPIGYYPLIKGSQIQISRGFYDANYSLINTVLRYTGIITSYSIQEDRIQTGDTHSDIYSIVLQCSSFRQVLENRVSGRRTNSTSWKYWNPTDTSMDRVAAIENTKFAFGRPVVTGSVNNGGGGSAGGIDLTPTFNEQP